MAKKNGKSNSKDKGKRRSNAEIARDRALIAGLYFQGFHQIEIADKLDISQPTVSRDIAALQADWLKRADIDFNEAQARELARLDMLERTTWEAWYISIGEKESTFTEQTKEDSDGKSKSKAQVKKEKLQGDPRFLKQLQSIIDQRCRLLGLYAPAQYEFTGKGGGPIQHETRDMDAVRDERWAKVKPELEVVLNEDQPTESENDAAKGSLGSSPEANVGGNEE